MHINQWFHIYIYAYKPMISYIYTIYAYKPMISCIYIYTYIYIIYVHIQTNLCLHLEKPYKPTR